MKKLLSVLVLVIALVATAKVASFVITAGPQQTETIATVVASYDNTIVVETPDGNVYEFFGNEPKENIMVVTICNDAVVDAHSIPNNYTIGEVKDLAEEAGIYYIIKNENLDKLNPADYEDSAVINCGLIDDIDELGYCFFI